MEIDYKSMTALIDIRLKQIDCASKEHEYFNKEHRELAKIRKSLTELILLERHTPSDYVDKCNPSNPKQAESAGVLGGG